MTAMQFEWAWQHVGKSKAFRAAVGCDRLARRMKRRRGTRPRLDELGVLLADCAPFNAFSLKVYSPDAEYLELFCTVSEGKDFTNMEVCALEAMPFAKGKSTETKRHD